RSSPISGSLLCRKPASPSPIPPACIPSLAVSFSLIFFHGNKVANESFPQGLSQTLIFLQCYKSVFQFQRDLGRFGLTEVRAVIGTGQDTITALKSIQARSNRRCQHQKTMSASRSKGFLKRQIWGGSISFFFFSLLLLSRVDINILSVLGVHHSDLTIVHAILCSPR
uniref:Uncharacterized protein n=1 Tax=Neovison vison TaxID=452646 RepID=A0A8C7B1E2_NEOVI